MNSLLKKFSIFTFIFITVFATQGSLSVFAQSEYEILDEFGTTMAPNLFVGKINVTVGDNRTGKLINGSFSVFNAGKKTADAVSHRINIITTEKINGDLYPKEIITSGEISDSYSLPSGEQRNNFSILVPDSVPVDEEFAIYIDIYIGDEAVTYEYVPVSIVGDTKDYVSYEGRLYIGDVPFFYLEGPTVAEGENIKLGLSVSGEKEYKSIIPEITIFSGPSTGGEVVTTVKSESFSLEPGVVKEEVYDLPVDLGPGVYTVQLNYLDSDGEIISPTLEARYILDGLKSNIHQVTFNDLNQNNIEDFIVSVLYADKPLNARLDESGSFIDPRAENVFVKEGEEPFVSNGYQLPNNISIKVSLIKPSSGEVIEEKMLENVFGNPVDFNFEPIERVFDLLLKVVLIQDGEVVDEYESNLDIIPKQEDAPDSFLDFLMKQKDYVLVAMGVVVVVVLVVMLALRSVNKKVVITENSTKKPSPRKTKVPVTPKKTQPKEKTIPQVKRKTIKLSGGKNIKLNSKK